MKIFGIQLLGFEPSKTTFAFPYNASIPELESWLPGVVRAFRTTGDAINPLPCAQTVKLTTGDSEGAEARLDLYLRGLIGLSESWSRYPISIFSWAREILAWAKQRTLFVLYD